MLPEGTSAHSSLRFTSALHLATLNALSSQLISSLELLAPDAQDALLARQVSVRRVQGAAEGPGRASS